MLVTDAGRLIRVPADQVRITGRHAMGVRLFRLENGERVTSVFPVVENGVEEAAGGETGADEAGMDETRMGETGGEEAGDG
ncbi:MAG: DNA gyrase C-terminal beta-propeller domain-containing protein, partial [Acetobacteraceae bacterium]